MSVVPAVELPGKNKLSGKTDVDVPAAIVGAGKHSPKVVVRDIPRSLSDAERTRTSVLPEYANKPTEDELAVLQGFMDSLKLRNVADRCAYLICEAVEERLADTGGFAAFKDNMHFSGGGELYSFSDEYFEELFVGVPPDAVYGVSKCPGNMPTVDWPRVVNAAQGRADKLRTLMFNELIHQIDRKVRRWLFSNRKQLSVLDIAGGDDFAPIWAYCACGYTRDKGRLVVTFEKNVSSDGGSGLANCPYQNFKGFAGNFGNGVVNSVDKRSVNKPLPKYEEWKPNEAVARLLRGSSDS
jgi:hypothetical protein